MLIPSWTSSNATEATEADFDSASTVNDLRAQLRGESCPVRRDALREGAGGVSELAGFCVALLHLRGNEFGGFSFCRFL
jgi:hypothetical protein